MGYNKILFVLLVPLIFFSCDDMVSDKEIKHIATIKEIKNGETNINVELRRVSAGWNIFIGDPEINKELENKNIKIEIINMGDTELRVWTNNGVKSIGNSSKIEWFSGTFDLLWKSQAMKVYSLSGDVQKFKIIIIFSGKNIKISRPISIDAMWHDSL